MTSCMQESLSQCKFGEAKEIYGISMGTLSPSLLAQLIPRCSLG